MLPRIALAALAAAAALTPLAARPHASSPATTGREPSARAWRATLAESDGIEIVVHLTLRFRTPTTWELYSREGGARSHVSWVSWMAGGLLGKRPPHGAVLWVANGTAAAEGDGVTLRGQLESPFLGRRWFVGRLQGDRWRAELRRGSETGAIGGTLDAVAVSSTPPVRDYASLAGAVRRTISDAIYDPSLPHQPRFRRFFEEIDTAFGRARDDLDVMTAFEAARARLGTSHVRLVRNPRLATTPLDAVLAGDPNVNPETLVRLNFSAPGVAYLRITKWDRVAASVDRAFERIAAARATTLILDIRGNPGGDATSMSPMAHLVERRVPVGLLLGRPWYSGHREPPAQAELPQLPIATPETSPLDVLRYLDQHGAIAAWIEPRAPRFTGDVFVVTDRRTASASEPLAHLLKTTGRATLVGEQTAGAMLLALPHPLTDGFVVVVPTADYFAGDGTRLEGRGVQPHLKSASAEALVVVANRISRTRPYPGTLLLGGVYRSLGRWDEAERAYRLALRLAPTDADRAVVQRQLDAMATERKSQELQIVRSTFAAPMSSRPGTAT